MSRVPCLKVGCHNVNGLTAKIEPLTAHWRRLTMDIVVAVDTHLDFFAQVSAQRQLAMAGWHAWFSPGYSDSNRGHTKAGVAILVRQELILSGVLEITNEVFAPSTGPAQGRLLALPVSWAGQHFTVVGTYFHASNATANASIITGPLAEAYRTAHGTNVVVLGDFNFVLDTNLDRRHLQRSVTTHPRDAVPAAAWNHQFSQLHDAWRILHPHRRAFTYVRSDAASRIDRVYVSSMLLPQLATCVIADRHPPVSDHWLTHVQLLPHGTGKLGPGLPRMKLSFLHNTECQQAFLAWLTSQHPPTEPNAILNQWWGSFKASLKTKVHELNRAAKQQQPSMYIAHAAAAAAVVDAHAQLDTCADDQLPSVLGSIISACSTLAAVQTQMEQAAQSQRRQRWIHINERPGPAMSKIMQPPKAGTFLHALRAPGSGHLIFDSVGMARIIGHQYASVCATPHTDQQKCAAVLQAVTTHSQPLTPDTAESVGSTVVTADEIVTAISSTAPGKAPGLDGIPGELFRRFKMQLAPLLAALYSAIGALGRVPAGFLDGVILPILKPGGQKVDPTAYRPIQLLNYDYRILAKVLVNRMLPVMGQVIHPSQCAFLPNRHIRDSIRLLQMLPALLSCQNASAVAVFTDFQKAYDTVDRSFLCAVANNLGVGAGFQQWMRTLLTDTYTQAHVNGFLSSAYKCEAGVRQGCPLSPLLYLFVGQALWCWLQQQNIGIHLANLMLTSTQYADDAEPFLPSLTNVPHFQQCMADFAAASGQHLNIAKTHMLPLGQHPPSAADVMGFSVTTAAKSLGVSFTGTGSTVVDWDARMTAVKRKLQKITDIPNLSAFGRAFAANAYALSTLLYAAQFAELPNDIVVNLHKWTSALVDARLGPEDCLRRPPGIPADCLCAHPRDGGLGLLPVDQHLLSRWACEGRDLLLGSDTMPWIAIGRLLWQQWTQTQPPATQAAGASIWGLLLCDQHTVNTLPQPLQCFAKGLHALPPLQHIGEHPVDIHSMCWTAPLWSNPLFTIEQQWSQGAQQHAVAVALEHAVPQTILTLPFLQSVGQAVVLRHELQRVCASNSLAAHASYNMSIWPTYLQHRQAFADRRVALQQLQALIALLPASWVEAAEHHFQHAHQPVTMLMSVSQSDIDTARQQICGNLGWPAALISAHHMHPISFASVTVAAATRLQQSPIKQAIAARHALVLHMIEQLADDLHQQQRLPTVTSVLHRWWQLKISNTYKEAAWRLTLNAFPTAQRMHISSPCPACGQSSPGLQHHFWLCSVAEAVKKELQQQLRAHNMSHEAHTLHCANIWLAQSPSLRLHPMIWDMVCLAAIYAMEVGRRTSWAVAQKLAAPPLVNMIASKAAVAAFWDALADFTVTCKIRPSIHNALLTNHPFIVWCIVLRHGNGLRVIRH